MIQLKNGNKTYSDFGIEMPVRKKALTPQRTPSKSAENFVRKSQAKLNGMANSRARSFRLSAFSTVFVMGR